MKAMRRKMITRKRKKIAKRSKINNKWNEERK